ncbi:MAG: hypothetical protein EPN36_06005 [Rhodanobacteraceae bacterium]|nr:MAG: hypothetical protein EPN36_06005 [Rhodanobacteraceae bacterium]
MYKPLRWALTAMLLAATSTAFAQGFDITAGPTVTSGARFTSAAFASVFGEQAADDHFHFAPIATVGWIAPHHTYDENLHHDVFLAGGGVRIVAPGGHWFASEQLAATSTRTDALSSRFEFMTSGGWQDGHFIVMVRHISNGHIVGGSPNLGETMLLAGVRF